MSTSFSKNQPSFSIFQLFEPSLLLVVDCRNAHCKGNILTFCAFLSRGFKFLFGLVVFYIRAIETRRMQKRFISFCSSLTLGFQI